MSEMISRQAAERFALAFPVTAEVLLVHGPDLIDTLVPGPTLEVRLAPKPSHGDIHTELLFRLREQRAKRSASGRELHQDRLFDEVSAKLHYLARRYLLLHMRDDLHWAERSI